MHPRLLVATPTREIEALFSISLFLHNSSQNALPTLPHPKSKTSIVELASYFLATPDHSQAKIITNFPQKVYHNISVFIIFSIRRRSVNVVCKLY
jgi:hypothetical protein